MDQRGKSIKENVIAIIPARYASVRLPGKMLREIAGKPLILHTLEQAMKARSVNRVIVATDDQRIFAVVKGVGGEAVMTSNGHASGSDRIAEVARTLAAESLVVNVQGDEPLISPATIDLAVQAMVDDAGADIVTTCTSLTELYGELLNGNVVKVVVGDDGYALYFSRSPIPFPRDASLRHGGGPDRAIEAEPELMANFRRHTGLYVYRREYLLRFAGLPQTTLERIESLEQLRALEDRARIRVVDVDTPSMGVDTESDLARVAGLMDSGVPV
ncbi:MAG: 3-deoxy-manno-octulosonate cytidylyltransferase [Pyrinomonadaceae bacterium]